MACNPEELLAPNPRLQRTRAALLLGVLARCAGKAVGGSRVPLKRKPLGGGELVQSVRLLGRWIVLASSLTTISCASVVQPVIVGLDLSENAKAAVLAKLANGYGRARPVFVCVDLDDASQALLDCVSRLSGTRVKPCHARVADDRWPGVPVDPETGVSGVVIGISKVKRLSDTEYQMEGGYACGLLCAAEFEYRVRRGEKGWVISSETMLWIS